MKNVNMSLLFLFLAVSIKSQVIQVKKGSLDFLTGLKEIRVTYDYSDMLIGYDNEKEEDYVTRKVQEHNSAKPGKGDFWKAEWYAKRKMLYEPAFEESFNAYAKPIKLTCGKKIDGTSYEMVVHTTWTELGYNIPTVTRGPSIINVEVVVREIAASEEKVILLIEKCKGEDLEETYEGLGRILAKYYVKSEMIKKS